MNVDEICDGLFNALEQFDRTVLPLGLYASDDLVEGKKIGSTFQEWKGAIAPYLAAQGYPAEGMYQYHPTRRSKYFYSSSFLVPDLGLIGLKVVKFSNIKVRKYGSGYQVDKHENREYRWQEVDLGGHISNLWKQQVTFAAQILLFIGFDKGQRPLDHELFELHEGLNWENKGVADQSRTWSDKAQRGFGVRLTAWSKMNGVD